MSRRWLTSTVLLVALRAGAQEPVVRVEVRGAHLDVDAAGAPVGDVLERIGEAARVRVRYVGDRPRALVSLQVRGRSGADTLMLVLARLGPGYGYALGWTPDRTRIAAVVITHTKSTWIEVRDPFEPPPGKGEALEPVLPAWELEARRELARLSPPVQAPPRREPEPADASEPTFGHGPDPFTPPEGRGDALEPVAPRKR